MRYVKVIKLFVLIAFLCAGALVMLLNNRVAAARSSGPDPGFTGAPGEFDCRECHLPDGAPPGTITVAAPQTYVPGQTYQITFNESNAHPSRRRWGFQLTALDDTGTRAGTLQPGGDGRTQVVSGTTGNPARQYVEHTSAGTYQGQQNSASWTFNWTAPGENVGPVLFYFAGNQANNDGNTSGDSINFGFVSIQPAVVAAGDFAVTVTPAAQTILPGASGSYTVTVTPSSGFTGSVNLSVAGLPANTTADFNPAAINITDATARTSTLTVTNTGNTPLGNFALTVTGTNGGLTRMGA
ncbi:MAG: Reeler domain-containing protein, partial [Acidobacteriota bacterium]|nr:Reeler domain-containing protein [Acidobacteriota bacterium]